MATMTRQQKKEAGVACPTPQKRRYPTQEIAFSNALKASYGNGHGMRAYHCRCGAWHLTSKPMW